MAESLADDLIPMAEADDALERLAREGRFVLGIEGFTLFDDGRMPDTAMIADFSELSALPRGERARRSVEAARRVLALWREERPADRHLEFVLD